jgi:hypothetical protein
MSEGVWKKTGHIGHYILVTTAFRFPDDSDKFLGCCYISSEKGKHLLAINSLHYACHSK